MTLKDVIKKLQQALNSKGEKLTVDGDLGPVTQKALNKYDIEISATKKPETLPVPTTGESKIPWYHFAKKYNGKKETDPAFNKMMSAKWSLFGMNLGTISQSWAAWCGLAVAFSLAGVGYDYQKNGSLARNWHKYAVEIVYKTDGIPKGSIVQINHKGICKDGSSGNHVAFAEGDCAPQDIFDMVKNSQGKWVHRGNTPKFKSGATFDLYGGNQGNSWKVSTYPVWEICAVRWPKEEAKPKPVFISNKCSSRGNSDGTQ